MLSIESLIQDLESEDIEKRYAALKQLGEMELLPDEALAALRNATGHSDPFTSISAKRVLDDHTSLSFPTEEEHTVDLAFLNPNENKVLACDSCGRVDETLRYSEYPFVISLVFITFRREFSGLWCRRHRNLYSFLASFITATIGWIGIPFGFIYTPRALFKLARGGERNPHKNLAMLKELGEAKLEENNPQGAIRCFEAVIEYGEDKEVVEHLRELYRRYRTPPLAGGLSTFLPVTCVLLGSVAIGMTIGILDYWINLGISSIVPEEGSIILIILTWTPFIAMAFLGGLLLQQLIFWGLVRAQVTQKMLGIILAVVAASLAIYGIPQGSMIADYFSLMLSDSGSGLTIEAINITGSVLALGGIYYPLRALEFWGISGVIYLVLLLTCGAYYYTSSIMAARRTTNWMGRLAGIRRDRSFPADRNFYPAWLSIAAVILGLSAFSILFNDPEVFNPDPALSHNDYALELIAQGDYEGARMELEEAIRLSPDFTIAHSNLGWVYANLGEVDKALEECQVAIDLDPESAYAYDTLGWISYYIGDMIGAEEAFKTVVLLNPQYAEGYFGLGLTQYWMGETESAGQSFQNAMDLGLDDGSAKAGLGLVYLDQDRFEEAEALLHQAVDLGPDFYFAQYGLGYFYFAMDDPDTAEPYLRKAIELNPQFDTAHYFLALVHQQRGEFKQAIELLTTASELAPQWGVPHAVLAGIYYQQDQLDLMEHEVSLAEEMAEEDGYTQYILGSVYLDLGEYARAENLLLSAIELQPDDENLYLALARIFSAQKEYSKALEASDRAIEMNSDDTGGHLARAQVLIEQGNLDVALNELQKLAARFPDDWQIHSCLGFVYYEKGNLNKGRREAEAAVRSNPYDTYGHTNLAFIYYDSNEPDLGLEASEKAVSLEPKYDRPHYIQGMYYMDKGDKDKAITEFETFLELYKDREIIRELKTNAEAYLKELRSE